MTGTAEPVRRTTEIEEVTNLHFIHPLAARLVPLFAALGISANIVSVAGMVFGVLAGLAYNHYLDPRWAIAGFVLMIAWHILDGADGQLARLTNSQSETGKILDGICDYVTFIAVYVGLAIALAGQYGNEVWLLVGGAGICHAVQAAAYELQRQEYNFWGLERKSAAFLELAARPRHAGGSPGLRVSDLLYRAYTRLQFVAAGITPEFHERLGRALQAQPERAAAIRQHYREIFAPSVRRWSVMSSNYRTFGIFLCAVLGAPRIYFWYEIVGLSGIMAILLYQRRARYALFFQGLEATAP
ncbi:MAG TPA: CDP-alcohol phosphatidyltransferase family protein [Aliidongia sp.]|uniref:CDP-alcohol phosphatidyltransferase family protein n=1 Tax=Aliidongia sp. TaxID=1914230 RepID=UPI002DDCD756|nr:CDP-alcohol phosphatidyltransferase family protein [Aliidongia sp.]HEV2678439.1 CDP-alcohol phosphatidyltransferase family protein [Aliidongia sp.]